MYSQWPLQYNTNHSIAAPTVPLQEKRFIAMEIIDLKISWIDTELEVFFSIEP